MGDVSMRSQAGRRAGPLVALSCLFHLTPDVNQLLDVARLQDVRCFLKLLHLIGSASAAPLITSELQSSVELSLRRVSIMDGVPMELQGEVSAFPFWIDLIVKK